MAPNKLEKLRQKYQEKVDAFQVTESSPTVSVEAPFNKEREYTDKCFLAVLVMAPLVMLIIGGAGWATGNLARLGSGIDGMGNLCYDLDKDHTYKYVYHPNLAQKLPVRFYPEPNKKVVTLTNKTSTVVKPTTDTTTTTNTTTNKTLNLESLAITVKTTVTKKPFVPTRRTFDKLLTKEKLGKDKEFEVRNVPLTYNMSRPSSVCVKKCPEKIGDVPECYQLNATSKYSKPCAQLKATYATKPQGTNCMPTDLKSQQHKQWIKRNARYKFPKPIPKKAPPKKKTTTVKKPTTTIVKKKMAAQKRSLYSTSLYMEWDDGYMQTLADATKIASTTTAAKTATTTPAAVKKEPKEQKQLSVFEVIRGVMAVVMCSTVSIIVAVGYLQVLALHPLYVTLGSVVVQFVCIGVYWVSAMAMAALYDGVDLSFILVLVMLGYAVVSCVYLICMFCNQGNAEAIIEGTAQYMKETKRVMFVPIFYWFIGLMTTIITVFFIVGCYSTAKPSKNANEDFGVYDRKVSAGALILMGIPILGVCLYFLEKFFGYKLYYIMSHSVSSYYFTSNKETEGSAEVMESFMTSFKHMGSFSFAAFLMTLIMIIKKIAEAIESAYNGEDEEGGIGQVVMKMLICCIRTCLSVIEEIIDMLSKASFSYMSITGESYCQSGKNGFLLYLKHLFSLAAVFFVTNSIQFIGAATCTAVTVCISQFIAGVLLANTIATFVCVFLMFFLAGFTSEQFLDVFESAVYQMLLCFAFDKDLHMGEVNYGPPKLHYTLEENMKEKEDVNEQLMNETPEE